MQWHEKLEALYGVKMTEAKARQWYELISELTNGVTPALLESVVSWSTSKRQKDDRAPTVEKLISWVKWYRKEQAQVRHGSYPANSRDGRMARIKDLMEHAKSWTERWNYLCDECKDINECYEMDAWARGRWPDWEAKKLVVKEMIKKDAKEAYCD